MPNTDELKSRLTKLGFNYLADNFADFCAQNQKKNRSIYEIIEQIASLETEEKLRRGILRHVTSANLGRFRALSEYDWLNVNRKRQRKAAPAMTQPTKQPPTPGSVLWQRLEETRIRMQLACDAFDELYRCVNQLRQHSRKQTQDRQQSVG